MDLSRPARVARYLKWLAPRHHRRRWRLGAATFSTSEHGAAGRSGAHFLQL